MPNHLIDESSAYLLQHAHNPVDWHPWCEEAFERARAEDKPVLLSIGYSACHWCHVMAHESFEDEAIAALMNRLFVNITTYIINTYCGQLKQTSKSLLQYANNTIRK